MSFQHLENLTLLNEYQLLTKTHLKGPKGQGTNSFTRTSKVLL